MIDWFWFIFQLDALRIIHPPSPHTAQRHSPSLDSDDNNSHLHSLQMKDIRSPTIHQFSLFHFLLQLARLSFIYLWLSINYLDENKQKNRNSFLPVRPSVRWWDVPNFFLNRTKRPQTNARAGLADRDAETYGIATKEGKKKKMVRGEQSKQKLKENK